MQKILRTGSLVVVSIFASGMRANGQEQLVGGPAALRLVPNAKDGSAEPRVHLAESLVEQREKAMKRPLSFPFRARLVERVATLPLGTLHGLEDAGGEGPLLAHSLGDSGADLVYTPVTPCRVFDTRSATAGALSPGSARDFLVAGVDRFAGQGGTPGGCGVPLGPATAVVVNLVAVSPTGSGNLRAWAVANPTPQPPAASVLNFGSVAGLEAFANAVVVPICDEALAGGACPADLRLMAFGSGAHVVGDVLGYFRNVDLPTELPQGVGSVGPFPAPAGSLELGLIEVQLPARPVDCLVTCSINVTSTAPNTTGQAFVQGGAGLVDMSASIWGGAAMYAAPVAVPGSSSATTSVVIGFGAGLRVRFGCFVSAAGDFLGDEVVANVSWSCR